MNGVITISSIALALMILLSPSYIFFDALKEAKGQVLPNCPIGYQRNVLGACEPVSNLQTCPVGYQRSVSGICVPIASSQICPVGYQIGLSGVCVPITESIGVNPYTPQTTVTQPQTTVTQPQPTFTQPSSSTGLMSPTLTSPPSGGEMSPWFPSLPAIACGGTSTMTTIGSLEGDNNDSNGNNGNNDKDDDKENNGNDDNDDDKKEYAFQIESDGGPSADHESVDGTVFAGEKNIERNNGRDFDIRDVFNDCQVSMFND
jgi:hypothetical protein